MPNFNPYVPQPMGQQFAPYQPQGYMTAGTSPMLTQQQAVHGFVYVTGIDGAKAYQMPPNSEMPLFDSTGDRDRMYIKTTDGAGFPTIVPCKVIRLGQAESQPETEYVTHDELRAACEGIAQQVEQLKGDLYGTVPAAAAES